MWGYHGPHSDVSDSATLSTSRVEGEQPPRYIQFLSQMLLRPFEETGTELLVALCNQIALMSQVRSTRLPPPRLPNVFFVLLASPHLASSRLASPLRSR